MGPGFSSIYPFSMCLIKQWREHCREPTSKRPRGRLERSKVAVRAAWLLPPLLLAASTPWQVRHTRPLRPSSQGSGYLYSEHFPQNTWKEDIIFETFFSRYLQATIISFFFFTCSTEAEFLDEIQTQLLRFFLLAIHSHLYTFEVSISSNSRNLLQFLQFSYCTL